MKVHVIHAHPVETSYNRALFSTVVEALQRRGHEVDALNLYDEEFQAAMSREERLNYHDVPGNLTALTKPYVDRIMATEAMVFVHPVWNYGYPAILKGYFDRIFLPGVSFVMDGGGDRGKLRTNLKHIRKVAFVTTYGGDLVGEQQPFGEQVGERGEAGGDGGCPDGGRGGSGGRGGPHRLHPGPGAG